VRRRLWITTFIAIVGIAEIAFAVQIRTWHGRGSWTGDPNHKRFIASWLASELWIDLRLLLVGGVTLVFAVVFFLLAPRLATRSFGLRQVPTDRSRGRIR
jgi:hypothetical protein